MISRNGPRALLLGAVVLLVGLVAVPAGAHDMENTDEGLVANLPPHLSGPQDLSALQAQTTAFSGLYEMYFPVLGPNQYSDTYDACRAWSDGICTRYHMATDIMADKMVPVVAVAAGTVDWIQNDPEGDCCALWIDHDDGWRTAYIHLNNDDPANPELDDGGHVGIADGIDRGVHVEAGQLIGWVGDSGNAEETAPHLHLELYEPGNIRTNPYPHLLEAAVLAGPIGPRDVAGCDFDGDGYHDLVVGAPGEDVGGSAPDAGTVTVLYGSSDGVGARSDRWHQGSAAVGGIPNAGDGFGASTTCGDVNGDGFDDLVVGVPGEDLGAQSDTGAINLLYGSGSGLTATGSNYWHLKRPRVPGSAEPGAGFGTALAAADFDGDGFDDVAVGVPGRSRRGKVGAGVVVVLQGSASGIDGTSAAWHENSSGVGGVARKGDGFGSSLAAGQFNGAGPADLAIGIPGENRQGVADTGLIAVLYGKSGGLTADGSQRWHQDRPAIPGVGEQGDRWGAALVAGDLNGDGVDDIAVGAPQDRVRNRRAGAVTVIYGTDDGLRKQDSARFVQSTKGIPGGVAPGGSFGGSLSVGDFNQDGHEDLVVGIADGPVAGVEAAGSVVVIPGGTTGLDATHSRRWHQNSAGIANTAETGDRFGSWLNSGDFSGVGVSDLVVGVPEEDTSSNVDNGAVHIIKGGATGLVAAEDEFWKQGMAALPGEPEAGALWGHL